MNVITDSFALTINDKLRRTISTSDWLPEDVRGGFRSMYEHALDHVRTGATTIEEIVRNVPIPTVSIKQS